jgi:Lipocalin-like domain
MNPRGILSISAIKALGSALLPTSSVAQQRTLKQQLVGAWTIVSYEAIAPDGSKRQMDNPNGVLIFEDSGRYAQVIARPDRPKYKNPGQPTTEELAAATADFCAAHAGTWSVSEVEKALTQRIDAALRPNNEGTDFRSSVRLTEDELRLTSVRPLATGARIDILLRRAESSAASSKQSVPAPDRVITGADPLAEPRTEPH